jgi:hypothetical protein
VETQEVLCLAGILQIDRRCLNSELSAVLIHAQVMLGCCV